jgi:hypothetical protein
VGIWFKLIEAQIGGVGGECGEECHRFFILGEKNFTLFGEKKCDKVVTF